MHYYDPYRSTMDEDFFTVILLLFLGQNITPIWKQCLAKLYFINFSMHQDPKNNWKVSFKIHFFSRLSLGRRLSNKVI